MNRQFGIKTHEAFADKCFLDQNILGLACELRNGCKPDDTVFLTTSTSLDHDKTTAHTLKVGSGHASIDAFAHLSDSDHVEKLRLTLYRKGRQTPLIISLANFNEEHTQLSRIPFNVTPAGNESPTAQITLEDLLEIIDDLLEYQPESLSPLLEDDFFSEYTGSVTFTEIVARLMNLLGRGAKETQARHSYSSTEPLILDSESPFGDKTNRFDVYSKNGKLRHYEFSTEVKQQIGTEQLHYGVRYRLNPKDGTNQLETYAGNGHTLDPRYTPEITNSGNTKDQIHTLTFGVETLRAAKL